MLCACSFSFYELWADVRLNRTRQNRVLPLEMAQRRHVPLRDVGKVNREEDLATLHASRAPCAGYAGPLPQ